MKHAIEKIRINFENLDSVIVDISYIKVLMLTGITHSVFSMEMNARKGERYNSESEVAEKIVIELKPSADKLLTKYDESFGQRDNNCKGLFDRFSKIPDIVSIDLYYFGSNEAREMCGYWNEDDEDINSNQKSELKDGNLRIEIRKGMQYEQSILGHL